MSPVSKSGGGRFLILLGVLALGGLLITVALQARSNRSTVADLKTQLDGQVEEMRGLRDRMTKLATERKMERQRADEGEQNASALSAEVASLLSRLETLGDDLGRTATERDEHLATRLDLSGRLEATETALAEARIARETRMREVDGLRLRLGAMEETAAGMEQELRATRAEFSRRFEQAVEQLEAATLKLQAITAEYQIAVRARRDAEKRAATLEADLRAALEKAVDLRADVDRLKEANAGLTKARDELSRRLKEVLEQAKEAEESPVDPTK